MSSVAPEERNKCMPPKLLLKNMWFCAEITQSHARLGVALLHNPALSFEVFADLAGMRMAELGVNVGVSAIDAWGPEYAYAYLMHPYMASPAIPNNIVGHKEGKPYSYTEPIFRHTATRVLRRLMREIVESFGPEWHVEDTTTTGGEQNKGTSTTKVIKCTATERFHTLKWVQQYFYSADSEDHESRLADLVKSRGGKRSHEAVQSMLRPDKRVSATRVSNTDDAVGKNKKIQKVYEFVVPPTKLLNTGSQNSHNCDNAFEPMDYYTTLSNSGLAASAWVHQQAIGKKDPKTGEEEFERVEDSLLIEDADSYQNYPAEISYRGISLDKLLFLTHRAQFLHYTCWIQKLVITIVKHPSLSDHVGSGFSPFRLGPGDLHAAHVLQLFRGGYYGAADAVLEAFVKLCGGQPAAWRPPTATKRPNGQLNIDAIMSTEYLGDEFWDKGGERYLSLTHLCSAILVEFHRPGSVCKELLAECAKDADVLAKAPTIDEMLAKLTEEAPGTALPDQQRDFQRMKWAQFDATFCTSLHWFCKEELRGLQKVYSFCKDCYEKYAKDSANKVGAPPGGQHLPNTQQPYLQHQPAPPGAAFATRPLLMPNHHQWPQHQPPQQQFYRQPHPGQGMAPAIMMPHQGMGHPPQNIRMLPPNQIAHNNNGYPQQRQPLPQRPGGQPQQFNKYYSAQEQRPMKKKRCCF
ncbi:unnamed protein product [Amoebophrya sp. A25]|nr:unnamed protein product [Amoebophrya sp. A25]|eukprot:GSA25T00016583001.1